MSAIADSGNRDLRNIDRFDGENFHLWKFQMHAVFMGTDLLTIVEGSEPKPTNTGAEQTAWIKCDSQAISLLYQTLDKKHHGYVAACTSSHAIWDKIRIIQEQDSGESVHALQQKFFKCSIEEGESIASFLRKIDMAISQLASRGDMTFTSKALSAKIMSNLLAGYDSVMSAWECTLDADKMLENLTLRLFQQEARLKN